MSGQIPPVGVPPTEGAPPLLPPPQASGLPLPPALNPALTAAAPIPRMPPPFQPPPGGMVPPNPMGVPPMGLPVMGGAVPRPMPGFPPRVPTAPILNGPPRWQPPRVPVPGPTSLPVISAGPLLAASEGQSGDVFVSTVFVGNISDRASDGLVRQLLMKCGKINSWKRVQGTAGKLQAFGFCEYANPESTLRALRLLHSLKLGSKSLTVKVDSKSRKDLTKYIFRKKKVKEGLSREEAAKAAEEDAEKNSCEDTSAGALEEELDEDTVAHDAQIKEMLVAMVKEHANSFDGDDDSDLKQNVTEAMISMARQTGKIGPDENTTDIDENVRDRVSDEIKRFRENYKKSEDQRMKEIQKQQEKDRHSDKVDKGGKERERERDREKDRDRDRGRDRERDTRSRKSRSRSRHRSRSRSRERRRSRSPVKSREKRDRDWEEEMEERRLEKRKRERQDAYEERLRDWEMRERRKVKESRRRVEREELKKEDLEKNKKKADRMMAEYDDDDDDYRYYKGNTLADRLRDRELEVEEDEKDRLREREELEKQASLSEDEEEEKENAGDQQWAREVQQPAPQPLPKDDESDEKEEEGEGDHQLLVQQKPIPFLKEEPPPVINAAFHSEYHLAEEDNKPKVAFEIGGRAPPAAGETSSGGGVKRMASGVFGVDEEHEEGPKKKPLTRPSAVEEQSAPPPIVKEYSAEERKKVMKTLVDSIPTSKGDLFAYQIKWDYLDTVLIDKRIGPWINKKIMEYIGEEEPALTEFIINNLKQHCTPRALLDEISMILDDEGEVFVVKLWRLLIYETEAKVLGISKVV